jgi:hypothetical protein
MADEYIACIRRIRPHGPYHLCGYCNAGLVAYEMARRLSQTGEEVSSLILINTAIDPQTVSTTSTRSGEQSERTSSGGADMATTSHRTTAADRYRPQPYAGAISLLWPKEERGDLPPDLGWRTVCDRVELTYIGGSHDTCVTTHISELAVELNQCISAT